MWTEQIIDFFEVSSWLFNWSKYSFPVVITLLVQFCWFCCTISAISCFLAQQQESIVSLMILIIIDLQTLACSKYFGVTVRVALLAYFGRPFDLYFRNRFYSPYQMKVNPALYPSLISRILENSFRIKNAACMCFYQKISRRLCGKKAYRNYVSSTTDKKPLRHLMQSSNQSKGPLLLSTRRRSFHFKQLTAIISSGKIWMDLISLSYLDSIT